MGLRILGKASRSWGAGEMGFLRPEPLESLVVLPHVQQKILESLRLRETCLTASLPHPLSQFPTQCLRYSCLTLQPFPGAPVDGGGPAGP